MNRTQRSAMFPIVVLVTILGSGCSSTSPTAPSARSASTALASPATPGSLVFKEDLNKGEAGSYFAADPSAFVKLGRAICTDLDKGRSVVGVYQDISPYAEPVASGGPTAKQQGQLIATSVLDLCPRHTSEIRRSTAHALSATGPTAFHYDLTVRQSAGHYYSTAAAGPVLGLGRAVCGEFRAGASDSRVLVDLITEGPEHGPKATAFQQGEFVSTAVIALCPRYLGRVTHPTRGQ